MTNWLSPFSPLELQLRMQQRITHAVDSQVDRYIAGDCTRDGQADRCFDRARFDVGVPLLPVLDSCKHWFK